MKKSAILLAGTLFASGAALADDGPLRGAVDPTFVPHAMMNLAGELEGFNIDLAHEIARKLGRELEITPTEWAGITPGLESGAYDFNVSPTTVTEERAQNLLFTEPHIETAFQFMVPDGTEEKTALEDFRNLNIGVNRGSTYDMWATDLAEEMGWTVSRYGTSNDVIEALVSKRVDAAIAGNTYAEYVASRTPNIQASYRHDSGNVFSTAVARSNTELRDKLEVAIECLKIDGTMAQLYEKWFGSAPPENSVSVTTYPGFGTPGFTGYDPTEHRPDCG